MTIRNLLTVGEAALLAEFESRIEAALVAIRTAKLFRENHQSFAEYLRAFVERIENEGS